MARCARKSLAGASSLRQQLASLYASVWHVGDKARRGIAQECPLYVFRQLDDSDADGFLGSADVDQLHIVRPRMCDRYGISLDDPDSSSLRYGMKVIGRNLRLEFVYRLCYGDHVGKARVHFGCMPLVVSHIGKLLKKISNRKSLKVGRVWLTSSVNKVTLPTRVVRALLTQNHRTRRLRVQLRKPIHRAGAPVDLSICVAFRASGNIEELTVVRLRRFTYPFRIRPFGIVSLYEIRRWIIVRFGRSLVRMRQLADGENKAACQQSHGWPKRFQFCEDIVPPREPRKHIIPAP